MSPAPGFVTPGFICALTNPTHPDLNHKRFNRWYDEGHVPDVVNSGMADLAVRYKNLNPAARYQYLAIYRIPDLSFLADPEKMKTIPTNHPLLPGKDGGGGGLLNDVADVDIKILRQIQQFEPGVGGKDGRGKGLITVGIEPAEGDDAECDEWYRKQHLDMLSMCRGYSRSTRYKLLPNLEGIQDTPRFLALHEFETPDFSGEDFKKVVNSEWSKKILKGAQKFEQDSWQYLNSYGQNQAKL